MHSSGDPEGDIAIALVCSAYYIAKGTIKGTWEGLKQVYGGLQKGVQEFYKAGTTLVEIVKNPESPQINLDGLEIQNEPKSKLSLLGEAIAGVFKGIFEIVKGVLKGAVSIPIGIWNAFCGAFNGNEYKYNFDKEKEENRLLFAENKQNDKLGKQLEEAIECITQKFSLNDLEKTRQEQTNDISFNLANQH